MERGVGKPPWGYWAVAVIALWWALLLVAAWTMDVTTDPAELVGLPEAQRAISEGRPGWMFAAYGIAAFSLLAGAIGLLLRRRWAGVLFLVSLAAFAVEFAYLFLGMDAIALLGAGAALSMPVLILVVGAGLAWFAWFAAGRGWCRGRDASIAPTGRVE